MAYFVPTNLGSENSSLAAACWMALLSMLVCLNPDSNPVCFFYLLHSGGSLRHTWVKQRPEVTKVASAQIQVLHFFTGRGLVAGLVTKCCPQPKGWGVCVLNRFMLLVGSGCLLGPLAMWRVEGGRGGHLLG